MASLDELNEKAEREAKEQHANGYLKNDKLVADAIPFCIESIVLAMGEFKGEPHQRLELKIKALQAQQKYHHNIWVSAKSRMHLLEMDLPQHWVLLMKPDQAYKLVNVPKDEQVGKCPCERFAAFHPVDLDNKRPATTEQLETIKQNHMGLNLMGYAVALPKDVDSISYERASTFLQFQMNLLKAK